MDAGTRFESIARPQPCQGKRHDSSEEVAAGGTHQDSSRLTGEGPLEPAY